MADDSADRRLLWSRIPLRTQAWRMVLLGPILVVAFIGYPLYQAHCGAPTVWYSITAGGLSVLMPLWGLALLISEKRVSAATIVGDPRRLSAPQILWIIACLLVSLGVAWLVGEHLSALGYVW